VGGVAGSESVMESADTEGDKEGKLDTEMGGDGGFLMALGHGVPWSSWTFATVSLMWAKP
jgi:hypothetical protein